MSIAVLIESDYFEKEIFYYQFRFPEAGYELHLLSRLWGQNAITFTGHEYKVPLECTVICSHKKSCSCWKSGRRNMANVRLAHIALNCQDPIATERFYSQFFGFERTRVYDPGENQVVMIKLGECYLELFRASEPRPMAPPEKDGYAFTGIRHFCLEVEDLDALLKQLGQAAKLPV